MFGKVADTLFRRKVADRPAEHLGPARCREHQLHQQLQRRGFASAVGTEEAEDLAPRNGEREAVERPIGALAPESNRVVLGELLGAKRSVHVTWCAPARTRSPAGSTAA